MLFSCTSRGDMISMQHDINVTLHHLVKVVSAMVSTVKLLFFISILYHECIFIFKNLRFSNKLLFAYFSLL